LGPASTGWLPLADSLCLCQYLAEYIARRGRENVTTEDIVRHVRPEGRAIVPDSIKAELLVSIKTFILSLA
jgi:enhancer of yellow 2 transcription factor